MRGIADVSGLIVRASTEADMARCAEIYGHHVLHGTASFEVDPPSSISGCRTWSPSAPAV